MNNSSDKTSNDLPDLPAPPYRSLVLVLLAFVMGYGLTLALEGRNSSPVTGYLYSDITPVYAEETGVVQKILAETGELADETSSLCIIQNLTFQKQIATQKKIVAELEDDLKKAKAQYEIELAWRNKSLEQEMLQTRLNAATYLQEKYNQQIEKQAWKQYLNRPRPVSHLKKPEEIFGTENGIHGLERYQIRAQLEQESAQNAEEVTTVQLRLCESRLDSLKKLKENLPVKVKESTGIVAIQQKIINEKKKLETLLKNKTTQEIKANVYGIVGPIELSSGDIISKGEKLFDIYHPEHIFVKVSIPSTTAAKVDHGSVVQLHFPNGERRKGRIKHKSFIASKVSQKELTNPSDDAEVDIIVEPSGKNWPKVSYGTAIQVKTL